MRREEYLGVAERLLAHVTNGTTDSAAAVTSIPAEDYRSALRHQREIEWVFRRLPLLLAFSCELPASGDYKALTVTGIPVLITRGRDGVVRAFMNVCAHRAAGVAPEGIGNCRRFTCMNHGWTYDDRGRLIGLADRAKFGEVDTKHFGLTALACVERAGMIFACLTPGVPIDLEHYLGGMLPELESLGLEHWHLYGRAQFDSPNWKIAHDGYLETYHLGVMHATTIGPYSIGNVATYDFYGPLATGPHQRLGIARRSILRLKEKPRDQWRTEQGLDFVRPVFPNTIFAVREDGGLVSQIFPGDRPDRSVTVQHHIFPSLPDDEAGRQALDERVALFVHTVRDEDTKYAFETQRGLASGALDRLTFGRNELGLHKWHASLQHYLEADDG